MSKTDPAAEKRFFSVREAAVYSGLSGSLLYKKLKERALRFYTVNSKIIIDRADLDELIIQGEAMSNDELLKKIKERKERS